MQNPVQVSKKNYSPDQATVASRPLATARLQLNAGERTDASQAWPYCNEVPAKIPTRKLIPFGIAKIRDCSNVAARHSQGCLHDFDPRR